MTMTRVAKWRREMSPRPTLRMTSDRVPNSSDKIMVLKLLHGSVRACVCARARARWLDVKRNPFSLSLDDVIPNMMSTHAEITTVFSPQNNCITVMRGCVTNRIVPQFLFSIFSELLYKFITQPFIQYFF